MRPDWDSREATALFASSEWAGHYLEEVACETDLAKLDSEAWKQFIAGVVRAFSEKLAEIEKADVPF